MSTGAFKKILGIATNVIVYLFLALCIFSVIFTVFSKKDADGAANVFGYQMRLVISDSMAECEHTDTSEFDIGSIPIGSMVFVDLVPEDEKEALEWYSELKVGDVLTFKYVYTTQMTITHRITGITPKYSFNNQGQSELVGYKIDLQGDNKNASNQNTLTQTIDTSITESLDYVIGKVVGKSVSLGFVMNLLKNPMGIVFIVIVPCVIIIFFEVIKIFNAFALDKKQKHEAEKEEKDNEIEELKRRLLELEKMNSKAPPDKDEAPEADKPTNQNK